MTTVGTTSTKARIIVPLDVSDLDTAEKLVTELASHVGAFKVGYQLGYGAGWQEAAHLVRSHGGRLFVDAKFDDIPNTVAEGARQVAQLDPQFLTVHASAGGEALRAAVAASNPTTNVLAVTVLTSIEAAECATIFGAPPEHVVVRFALLAAQAGAAGVVCSPQELEVLAHAQREHPQLAALTRVTPGVRPSWAAANDQKRVLTPAEAIGKGATYLVIGRPITNPPPEIGTPADAAVAIGAEITAALGTH
ncbi:MAG: orotidine-5'-phosphate decarboxylase [Mycobacteriales bacterium]